MLEDLTPVDLAWLAGIFEGEGYVGYTNNGHYRADGRSSGSMQITITQKGPYTANLIASLVGMGSAGTAFGKNREHNIFVYRVHGKKARHLIETLLPYMRLPHKIEQAQRAIREDNERKSWPRKMVMQVRTDGKKNWVYPGTNAHAKPSPGVIQ